MYKNDDHQPNEIVNIDSFDRKSGSLAERILFNNRPVILLICLALTVFLGFSATGIKLNASFEQMIPRQQPFIKNFLSHYEVLQGQGNAIKIVVQADKGTIIDPHYLKVLKQINDAVFLLPGVDRSNMSSLWTSNTRWLAVTPQGLQGGPVIDISYNGSPQQLEVVRQNIQRSGQVGRLVGMDFKSSLIYVPLLSTDMMSGGAIHYGELARELNQIRNQYANQGVSLHIIGFGMVVGDMINGIDEIILFFAISLVISIGILYGFTRCIRSTCLVVVASLIGVTWQMGLLPLIGYDLNPYSVLVPFLVFAIGMSHGAQKMNGVMQDIGRGAHPLIAARFTFRRLFMAGFAALSCDAISFVVLITIHIEAIRQLAILASLGVAILIFTNLIMLPILLSYIGVSARAATRSLTSQTAQDQPARAQWLWRFLDLFTRRQYAAAAIGMALVIATGAWFVGKHVQVGDISPGAPELRQSSQYNIDNAYMTSHYRIGGDSLVVLVDTKPDQCNDYNTLSVIDDLQWRLDQMKQVLSTSSLASFSQVGEMLITQDIPKWDDLIPNQSDLNAMLSYAPIADRNFSCSFLPIYVNLRDHRAGTLTKVIDNIQSFVNDPHNQSDQFKISLAGGNAGIIAATNIAIEHANIQMLALVYACVILFCFITFRSWRAVLCAVLPLVLTSLVAQALMVVLGIGIKVATLPVIALGVGIGVDYALYVLSITLGQLRAGVGLSVAFHKTLLFTGRVVLLTGLTLAVSVMTWAFAPIKFQADMGLLLSFMFVFNMLGALILVPSLACFLLPPALFPAHRQRV